MKETEIKSRILQAANDMMIQYGIRSVSMDDIAGSLGMSKKTLYQYFKDKDELVEQVIVAIIQKNECECQEDRKLAENAIHEIFLVIDMLEDLFKSMNPAVLFDLQKYHPKAYLIIIEHKYKFLLSQVKENLRQGIEQKLFRPDINIEIMSRYRIETMFMPFSVEFNRDLNYSIMECQHQIILNFLYGMVTPKGYEMIETYRKSKLNTSPLKA